MCTQGCEIKSERLSVWLDTMQNTAYMRGWSMARLLVCSLGWRAPLLACWA